MVPDLPIRNVPHILDQAYEMVERGFKITSTTKQRKEQIVHYRVALEAFNDVIGSVECVRSCCLQDCFEVVGSYLEESIHGLGVGSTLYSLALQDLGALHSNWSGHVSEEAAYVWSKLSKHGTPNGDAVWAIDSGYTRPDFGDKGLIAVDLLNFEPYFQRRRRLGMWGRRLGRSVIRRIVDFSVDGEESPDAAIRRARPWTRCVMVTESYLRSRNLLSIPEQR